MNKYNRILITGGSGFIGGTFIRKLINNKDLKLFNIDKMGYASDFKSLEIFKDSDNYKHYHLDLNNKKELDKCFKAIDPDIVFHFAAESHVDRSLENPINFINSNIIGTFNILDASLEHWKSLNLSRKKLFRFHHVSTDEVFGSLEKQGKFNELSRYSPNSPYSASKASSDHFVRAWHNSYGLPTIITNCSNNFGSFQFPEKLIPLTILKCINNQKIPLYGDGLNVRDWLYVEDHVDAIILAATEGRNGETYCIGGDKELSNKEVILKICNILDKELPENKPYSSLINYVKDRPGHDRRYAIDSSKIKKELGWHAKYSFDDALLLTVKWYLENQVWCEELISKSGH